MNNNKLWPNRPVDKEYRRLVKEGYQSAVAVKLAEAKIGQKIETGYNTYSKKLRG